MSVTSFKKALYLGACCLVGAGAVQAADLEAVKNQVQLMCANCHGYDGVATLPGAPNLSGQNQDYLQVQLEAYRSGKRPDPVMGVVAKSLSDEDIERLAAWYSNISVTVEPPPQPQ